MNLLFEEDADVAAKEIDVVAHELIEALEHLIPTALTGSEGATRAYVEAWTALSLRCLRIAQENLPDLVLEANGELAVVDAKQSRTTVGKPLLDYLAINAPFSSWVTRYGAGRGAAMFLLVELREAIPGLSPIPIDPLYSALPHWNIDREGFARFARHVWVALQREKPLLHRIQSVFDLSLTDLAGLFGVRRQAVSQWLDEGIPAARQTKALVVAQIADLLERNLALDRIPAIARTPARAYDDRSMLELIAEDRERELLAKTRTSFDWASTA